MERFDVVVVGGGSAGGPLAVRLSDNPDRAVLLLEAGPHYERVEDLPPEILEPTRMGAAFPGHPNNWSFLGALTPELVYSIPRGKILGGSSSINGVYFIRGTREDFERWAALGNDEWSFEKVLPYFRRIENDRDYHNEFHGSEGPVPVARDYRSRSYPVTEAFFQSALDMGYPEEPDKNAPGPPGVGLIPQNVGSGMRVSTAISHVIPNLSRRNLTVRGNAFVRRVVWEDLRAVGVEVEHDGRVDVIHADEVVLSAGSVKSPHLLMLSGIGPADDLRAQGVEVVHDSPGVGVNFTDHPHLTADYRPKERFTVEPGATYLPACLNLTSEGSERIGDIEILCRMAPFTAILLGSSGGSALGSVARILGRPLKTLRSLRGMSMRRVMGQARHQRDLSLGAALQQASSRGEIRLTSPDPHVQPEIRYNYLSEASDRQRMRQAVRVAFEMLESKAFRPLVERRTGPSQAVLDSDAELDRWMSAHLHTAIHLSSSCKMGPENDPGAVVDQYCRVRGVDGLRVVDTSIMPQVTSRGPNATAVMLGERAAEFFD
jgi:choline dehydrogenase